jgi:hypothetical protein
MGFFDFLTAPSQDTADLQREQVDLRKKKLPTPPESQPFQDEGAELSSIQAAERGEAQPEVDKPKIDPEQYRREYADKESSLIKRENQAFSKLKAVFSDPDLKLHAGPHDPDYKSRQQVAVFRNALLAGKLNARQALSDLDILMKTGAVDFRNDGATMGSGAQKRAMVSSLHKEISGLLDERGQFNAQASPVYQKQSSPEELANEAAALWKKSADARESAKNLGVLSSEKKIREAQTLEAQAASLDRLANQQRAQQPEVKDWRETIVPSLEEEPVTKYMNGLGVDREALVDRVHKGMQKVGIDPAKMDEKVDPRSGILRVVGELDKQGILASAISNQLAAARAEDAANVQNKGPQDGEDPKIYQTERAIQGKEDRLRQAYAELAQAPFMSTWPGIILYVLVGMITQNPAFAARLIGGTGNREALDREIKGLQLDLRRLDHQLEYRERMDAETKREAARRLGRKEDEVSQRKWEMGKLMLQHQLIIQRAEARQNPEAPLLKKLQAAFTRATGMAAKFSGEMQNEFADPDLRQKARDNFNFYMKKAAELDAQLQEIGAVELAGNEEPVDE